MAIGRAWIPVASPGKRRSRRRTGEPRREEIAYRNGPGSHGAHLLLLGVTSLAEYIKSALDGRHRLRGEDQRHGIDRETKYASECCWNSEISRSGDSTASIKKAKPGGTHPPGALEEEQHD